MAPKYQKVETKMKNTKKQTVVTFGIPLELRETKESAFKEAYIPDKDLDEATENCSDAVISCFLNDFRRSDLSVSQLHESSRHLITVALDVFSSKKPYKWLAVIMKMFAKVANNLKDKDRISEVRKALCDFLKTWIESDRISFMETAIFAMSQMLFECPDLVRELVDMKFYLVLSTSDDWKQQKSDVLVVMGKIVLQLTTEETYIETLPFILELIKLQDDNVVENVLYFLCHRVKKGEPKTLVNLLHKQQFLPVLLNVLTTNTHNLLIQEYALFILGFLTGDESVDCTGVHLLVSSEIVRKMLDSKIPNIRNLTYLFITNIADSENQIESFIECGLMEKILDSINRPRCGNLLGPKTNMLYDIIAMANSSQVRSLIKDKNFIQQISPSLQEKYTEGATTNAKQGVKKLIKCIGIILEKSPDIFPLLKCQLEKEEKFNFVQGYVKTQMGSTGKNVDREIRLLNEYLGSQLLPSTSSASNPVTSRKKVSATGKTVQEGSLKMAATDTAKNKISVADLRQMPDLNSEDPRVSHKQITETSSRKSISVRSQIPSQVIGSPRIVVSTKRQREVSESESLPDSKKTETEKGESETDSSDE